MDILSSLNESQLKPVLQTEGPVLVLAGAGSGKTRVLTSRIAYLINDLKVKPYNILSITFTNKAANEMKQRIEKMCDDIDGIWVSTIHSMCIRILRSNIDKIGYDKAFSIYAESESNSVINSIVKANDFDDDKIGKKARWHISNAKNNNMDAVAYFSQNEEMENIDEIVKIFDEYDKHLKKANALDFDDILLKTLRLLKENQEVREYYQDKFKYIHIDEFQDTNLVQYEIVRILSGKHKNLFAVGDDDQSIYSFRGADITNILNFEKDFEDAKVFKLEQNYRSTKKIIDVANNVIKNNIHRKDKTLFTENQAGVRVDSYTAYDDGQEAYFVASTIKSLLNMGYSYKDFAVLMRVNALSRTFEQEFLKYNLPYKVFGGFKFFERKEIKDFLSYLNVISNHSDDEAVKRSINTPKRGIGDTLVGKIQNLAEHNFTSMYEIIMNIDKYDEINASQKAKINVYADILRDINNMSSVMKLDELFLYALKKSGILEMFEENTDEGINKRENLNQLLESVNEFMSLNENATVFDFLTSVSLSSDLDQMDDNNYVTIATIHAVKGLEFKCVFVVGMEEGLLPISRALMNNKEIEEERRLMYVAVTRARERLYLTRSKSRFMYNKRSYTVGSRFLEEAFPKAETDAIQSRIQEIRQERKAQEVVKEDSGKFVSGTRVSHKVFGEGVVINVSGGNDNKMVEVMFKGVGVKKLSLNFAPLTIIKGE